MSSDASGRAGGDVTGAPDPVAAATRWIERDPDPETRAELAALVDAGDTDALAALFAGRLSFGTAGLRGALGPGPLRMNRVVVRDAAAGVVRYLLDTDAGAASRGLVVGFDARRNSEVFARDTAAVAAAMGMRVWLAEGPLPTPVVAFAIGELGAAGAVMVTASHNPPQDNGYKVYLGDGAQINTPHDHLIAERIEAAARGPVAVDDHSPLVEPLPADVVDRFLRNAAAARKVPADAITRPVRIAYTPLHGVGGALTVAALREAGFGAPAVVEAQFAPDGSFPTVSFPNPEEPGAMDAVVALASAEGCDLALANDPDADRLGVAVPTPEGWRLLRGDEIGWLLADHVLRHTEGDDRLVVTTLVSSALLGTMAEAHGVHYAETFTGFKWIARAVLERPGLRFVFGYEQALGYLVVRRPLDKDGISAAVLMAEVAAEAASAGGTLLDRLDAIAARYGRHVIAERSVRLDPVRGRSAVDALARRPPTELAGRPVTGVEQFPEATLLRLWCGTARLQVRPSGTEPKVKLYGEGVGEDPAPLLDALASFIV